MAFKIDANTVSTNDGIPFLWGSGDQSTVPSNQVKFSGSDTSFSDFFGFSVAVGSGRIVVGAIKDGDVPYQSGSAYIFDLNGTQIAKIKASDGDSNDNFGHSVAIGSGRIVVGAYLDDDLGTDSGSAYIFDLNGNQLAKIKASDGAAGDYFGESVAVGCGRIVVGAYGDDDLGTDSGSAYIFNLNGTQLAKIKASDGFTSDLFGSSVAVSCGRIVVGAVFDDDVASNSGSAYIFDLNGTQLTKIRASDGSFNDFFGTSISVGCGRIVVGAPLNDDLGSNSGAAYVFDLNGTQLAKIRASDGAAEDQFGISVAVGSGRIVVGASRDDDLGTDSGSAYVFDLDGNQLAKIKAVDGKSGDIFGSSVAVGSGRIVVGAYFAGPTSGSSFGSAYLFRTPLVYTPYDVIDLNSYGQ